MRPSTDEPRPARAATVREGYAAWAATYDDFSNPMITVADRVLRQGAPPVAGDRVCELGCGTGRNAPRVHATGAEYVGVDSSPEMLRRALRHTAKHPGLRFVQADLIEPRGSRAQGVGANKRTYSHHRLVSGPPTTSTPAAKRTPDRASAPTAPRRPTLACPARIWD